MQKTLVMRGFTAARQAACQACCMQLPTQIRKIVLYARQCQKASTAA